MKNAKESQLPDEQESVVHNHTLKEALEAKRLAAEQQQSSSPEKEPHGKQSGGGKTRSRKTVVLWACLAIVIAAAAGLLGMRFLAPNSFYNLFQINPLKSDDVVITIDQYEVSRDEYLSYIVPAKLLLEETYGAEALAKRDDLLTMVQQYAEQNLFGRYTLMKWAEAYGVTADSIPDEEFRARKAELIAEYGSEEAYKTYLDTYCTTEAVEDSKLRQEMVIEKLSYLLSTGEDPVLAVTDEQVQAYYRENELYTVKHVLLISNDFDTAKEKLESAKNILALALSGQDFDELVKLYSEDADKEAYLNGYICEPGSQEVPFEQAALSLAPGEIYSDVISTSYGYHILQRIEPTVEIMHAQLDDLIVDDKVLEKRKELQSQMLVYYAPGYDNISFAGIDDALAK